MTRVSLKEAYDNKDVVAQIYAIRDIAEGAGDTANNAVSTANTASEHVDALVPRVEGAVQNANNASASAQASAQTVAGYDGRLSALESADAQNVKIEGAQNITGVKTVPTEATGARSQQIANSSKIGAELDNYSSMLRTTNNQTFSGIKRSLDPFEISAGGTNAGLRLITQMDRTNHNSVFDDMLNWCDPTGNRIISIRATQDTSGTVKLVFLFHKPGGGQVNVGEFGIDANGNVVKSGVFV